MQIRHRAVPGTRDVVFFAAFAAYVWAGIDTRLVYHWQGLVFTTLPGFFGEFLSYPGGTADYIQALLSQAYAWRLLGALVVTAQVAAITALTRAYFKTLAGSTLPAWATILQYLPAGLLLYHFNLYYDRTPIMLSLLVGLALAIGFVHLSRRRNGSVVLLGASLTMAVAAYYLAGIAVVFFAPAAAIILIGSRHRTILWSVPLLLSASLPVAVETLRLSIVPVSARDWFLNADLRRQIVFWSLYGFYAAGASVILWQRPVAPARKSRVPDLLSTAALLVFLSCLAAASYRLNARDRRLTAIDYDALHEDWGAVLETAMELPGRDFNSLTRYEVNLALHETNRLGDEMFRFPQKDPMLLDLRADPFLPYMIRLTDMCLRLGRVNEAERFGSEAMLLRQRDPRVYRQMASVNMVKGRSAAARKFLTVLTYDPGSARWARERLRQLELDPQLARDGQIQLLRRHMLQTDDVFQVWQRPDQPSADLDRLLLDQLAQDPSNRMGFEFLMGNYLLARDIAAVHALMPRIANMSGPAYIDKAGKRRTPRYYQEAMAIYANATGQPVRIEGLEVQPETEERFEAFKRIVRQFVTREAAMQAVWNDFRSSYFFYFTFGPGDYR